MDTEFLMTELLLKFRLRIGALSQLKVGDIDKDNFFIKFTEKNRNIFENNIMNTSLNRLLLFITSKKLEDNDYLF